MYEEREILLDTFDAHTDANVDTADVLARVDAISRSRMQDELLDIWEQTQKTVVFITHAIDEAVLLADRVLVMGQGEIVREVPVPIQRPRRLTSTMMHTATRMRLSRIAPSGSFCSVR